MSFSGSRMQEAAILWHVSLLVPPESRDLALGMVGLVRIGPILGFSLLSGVVADALDRRRLMIGTQLAAAAVAATLALFSYTGAGERLADLSARGDRRVRQRVRYACSPDGRLPAYRSIMARLTHDPAFLAATDLLRGLPDAVLESIRPQLRERSLPAGQTLFREGDSAVAVYLIANGTLRIEKDGMSLASRSEGECVGEFALMDGGVRSASAVALTDVTLLEWPKADAWRALSASEELRHVIFRLLIGKLRQDVSSRVTAALEREQLQQDLRRAREIQEAMLPHGDLETRDMVISGLSRPALDVGGDYFDAVATAERTCSAVVADVAGHGLHAALLVAMAKSCFQTQVHGDTDTARIVEALNRSLLYSVRSGMLMSSVCVTIDAAAGVLTYTNAGHPPALHFKHSTGGVGALDATDPLLGIEIFRDASFNAMRTPWAPGDRLLMYTDGVTEARNATGEEFGRARVEHVLLRSCQLPAASIRERLADEVVRFTGDRLQDDDMTIVVVEGR